MCARVLLSYRRRGQSLSKETREPLNATRCTSTSGTLKPTWRERERERGRGRERGEGREGERGGGEEREGGEK